MTLALLIYDGFDSYGTSTSAVATKWGNTSISSVGATYGRLGSNGIEMPGGGRIIYTTPLSTDIVGVAIAVRPLAGFTAATLFTFSDVSGNQQVTIYVNANGSIAVRTGNSGPGGGGTLLGTTAVNTLLTGHYHHIEVQVKIHASAGTVDIWVDESTHALALTGQNTLGPNAVSTAVSFIGLGQYNTGSSMFNGYYDDYAVYDATLRSAGEKFGDQRVQTSLVTGPGSELVGAWTQVGGTGGQPYTALNETPPNNDTSYLSDGTPGDIATFTIASLLVTTPSVTAVAVNAVVRKDDASARQAALLLRTSTTDVVGSTFNVPSAYATFQSIFTTDPTTGVAFTRSGVNGCSVGPKVIA